MEWLKLCTILDLYLNFLCGLPIRFSFHSFWTNQKHLGDKSILKFRTRNNCRELSYFCISNRISLVNTLCCLQRRNAKVASFPLTTHPCTATFAWIFYHYYLRLRHFTCIVFTRFQRMPERCSSLSRECHML